eukprot:scaffold102239_cov63-Phaeocystis_antarctica.AAC.5
MGQLLGAQPLPSVRGTELGERGVRAPAARGSRPCRRRPRPTRPLNPLLCRRLLPLERQHARRHARRGSTRGGARRRRWRWRRGLHGRELCNALLSGVARQPFRQGGAHDVSAESRRVFKEPLLDLVDARLTKQWRCAGHDIAGDANGSEADCEEALAEVVVAPRRGEDEESLRLPLHALEPAQQCEVERVRPVLDLECRCVGIRHRACVEHAVHVQKEQRRTRLATAARLQPRQGVRPFVVERRGDAVAWRGEALS